MKTITFPLIFTLLSSSIVDHADAFPQFIKIKKQDVETQIRLNAKDADELISLISRAGAQNLGDIAYMSLRKIKKEQPENPVILAIFYYATDSGLKWRKSGTKSTNGLTEKQVTQERIDREEADEALSQASKIAPKLWLVPFNQGTRLYKDAYSKRQPYKYEKAMPLLKEALRLAPKSAFCWKAYGGALSFMAMDKQSYKGKLITNRDVVAAWETAAKVDPLRGPWLGLFGIYHFELKDRKNALRCKREYLKGFPKNRRMDPVYEKWFSFYPS